MSITAASMGKIYDYAISNSNFGTVSEKVNKDDDKLTFKFESGKLFIDADGNGTQDWDIDLSNLTKAQLTAMGISEAEADEILAGKTSGTDGTSGTDSTSKAEKQKQLDAKIKLRKENLDKMDKIEDDIKDLIDSIKEKTATAAAAQVALQEEQQDEVKKAIKAAVEDYVKNNRDSSKKKMTHEDLQSNIKTAIGGIVSTDIAAEISTIAMAQNELGLLDAKMTQLRGLIDATKVLEGDIKKLEGEINTPDPTPVPETPSNPEPENPKPTDDDDGGEPQGFQVEEDGQLVQYDFYIEKDGKEGLSSKEELMGYTEGKKGTTDEEIQQKGWEEMTRLNTNGDGVVDFGELTSKEAEEKSGGKVMVLRTVKNADGTYTQKAMTVEEAFGENSRYGGNIQINVNQEANKQDNIGPYEFGAEGYNNKVLGNFKVKLGTGDSAKEVLGYQTLDDEKWLDRMFFGGTDGAGSGTGSKVDFSKGETSKASAFGELNSNGMSAELQAFYDRLLGDNGWIDQADNLRAMLKDVWVQKFGCTALDNYMADFFKQTVEEGQLKIDDEEYYDPYMNENVRKDGNKNKPKTGTDN